MGNQFSILGIKYRFNRKIKLNDTEMTGYNNVNENLLNMNLLMKSVVDFRNYVGD